MASDALQIATRLRIDRNERSVAMLTIYSYVIGCMSCSCHKGKNDCVRKAMAAIGWNEELKTVLKAIERIEKDARQTNS